MPSPVKAIYIYSLIVTGIFKFGVRDLYTVPQIHSMLKNALPKEDIPHIDDLIQNVALLINHGSPFIGDGLRSVIPKTILAGFMYCNPPSPLPQDLAELVQYTEQCSERRK